MIKYLRPLALTMLVASAFTAQAQYSQYSGSGSWGGGDGSRYNASCESGDGSRQSSSLQIVGLTEDQRLICFNEKSPVEARDLGFVSGLMGDVKLIGIDFRVQDRKMYGVGDKGGIYMIDTRNAAAIKVSQLTVALVGASFGVDFNPPADRLRIVSDTGQNLRHNINTTGPGAATTIVDDPLDYPPATPVNAVGPNATGVTGSAYTNNDLDATTATTLYALDTNLDQVAIQSPPNDGTLAATGKLTIDANSSVGFDIYSTIRNGVTVAVQSLASLQTTDSAGNLASSLFSVSLPTGKATSRGSFSVRNKVIGIAIPLNQL